MQSLKNSILPGTGGSHLKYQLLRRQRSEGLRFEASLGKKRMRCYLKNTQQNKWTGGVALVIECLPNKCKALSFTAKINK
jgi:hypothetical protein